jgi:poly(glycerol-phosphate) alpha-glucosyltransferase
VTEADQTSTSFLRNADIANRRIGLLTASASRLGGGVFEAVVRHAELIAARGGKPVIFALEDAHSSDDRGRFGGCEVHCLPVLGPAQVGFAPQLVKALLTARLDCLHLHGIWMYPSRAGSVWARRTGKPYFISPHGMLDPWILARGRWKKALARAGYERTGWKRAHAFHALTRREAADIAAATGWHDHVIVPNAAPEVSRVEAIDRRGQDYAYLGRIHPKKNLAALVEAWEQLATARELPAGASLTIAGWGDRRDVIKLETRLRDAPPGLRFVGPLFGEDKRRLLHGARALVMPSLGEGLPMVVLEAWAAGTPVLMSEFCHLPEGFAAGAALDCGTDAGTIAGALREVAGLSPEAWTAMSNAAIGLATGTFSAETIARQWSSIYARAIADCHAGKA